jgi:hypothetical protein
MWRSSVSLLAIIIIIVTSGDAVSAQDRFPELRPDLKPPEGYRLKFRDGPDFYTWVLAPEKPADRHAGLGMYFSLHPQPIDKKVAKQVKGTVCSCDVSWWVRISEDDKDKQIWRETIITHEHGKEYLPIQVHLWVGGGTEQEADALAELLKSLKFVPREK